MNRRRNRQSGFTLYELLAAMTIGSVILMASTMLIGHAFDWTTQAKYRQQDDRTLFRLSRQFRSDVHDATDVVVTDETLTLTFTDNSTAIYTVTESAMRRDFAQDDASDVSRHESYNWHRPRETSFKIDSTTEQVVLTVKTPSKFSPPMAAGGTVAGDTASLWRSVSATASFRLKHQWGEIQP